MEGWINQEMKQYHTLDKRYDEEVRLWLDALIFGNSER